MAVVVKNKRSFRFPAVIIGLILLAWPLIGTAVIMSYGINPFQDQMPVWFQPLALFGFISFAVGLPTTIVGFIPTD